HPAGILVRGESADAVGDLPGLVGRGEVRIAVGTRDLELDGLAGLEVRTTPTLVRGSDQGRASRRVVGLVGRHDGREERPTLPFLQEQQAPRQGTGRAGRALGSLPEPAPLACPCEVLL